MWIESANWIRRGREGLPRREINITKLRLDRLPGKSTHYQFREFDFVV